MATSANCQGETEDAAAVASPPTPTKAALAASPPTPTRARDSVQSCLAAPWCVLERESFPHKQTTRLAGDQSTPGYARDSVHSTDAPPAARRVKIGSVEELWFGPRCRFATKVGKGVATSVHRYYCLQAAQAQPRNVGALNPRA